MKDRPRSHQDISKTESRAWKRAEKARARQDMIRQVRENFGEK